MNFDEYSYLYVEDDPLSREVMQVTFEATMGVTRLTLFADSQHFMERLRALAQPPSVILLDIHLEPHSGLELLAMIRSNPDYAASKVIALTASVMNEEVSELKACGFDGAIAKPIDVALFAGLMQRVLNHESVWHIV